MDESLSTVVGYTVSSGTSCESRRTGVWSRGTSEGLRERYECRSYLSSPEGPNLPDTSLWGTRRRDRKGVTCQEPKHRLAERGRRKRRKEKSRKRKRRRTEEVGSSSINHL